ncbi:TIGR03086 family metal-binding protein [Streptomyces sp. NPDC048518]|uniref:TIGR03086 family metal-binding protein n=1 Tax=Streptomyces sp. NPDC048518 TaxID=3155029 RepID=UPI0033EA6617
MPSTAPRPARNPDPESRHTVTDLVTLDRTAVQTSLHVLSFARDAADWERPTPCAGWTLRRLVTHMTAQHHGFAAAARGAGDDRTFWLELDLGSDPSARYEESVRHVVAAFAEYGAAYEQDGRERQFVLPELGGSFSGRTAVGFHLLDYVVHAWDVAVTLDVPVAFPDEVVAAALAVARRVPATAELRGPGAAFAPALPAPPDAGALDQVLTHLGRSPVPFASDVSRG